MTALSAGDLVLSAAGDASELRLTRVIVNQHAKSNATSAMIHVQHERGALSLTPDHVLFVNGQLVPARDLKEGAVLAPASRVTVVRHVTEGIINPLTVDGRILAAGAEGAPILASVYTEWIAERMLASTLYPVPLSLSAILARIFPARTQAYYDEVLEPLFVLTTSALKSFNAMAPSFVVTMTIVLIDAMLSLGLAVYEACDPMKLAATLAAVGLLARRGWSAGFMKK